MAYELKSCPFCGGEATLVEDIYNDQLYNYVICSNDDCNANTGRCDTQDEAIAKWNNRPSLWNVGSMPPKRNYTKRFWLTVKTNDMDEKGNPVITTVIGELSRFVDIGDAFTCWRDCLINGKLLRLKAPIPKEKVIAWMPCPEPYKEEE